MHTKLAVLGIFVALMTSIGCQFDSASYGIGEVASEVDDFKGTRIDAVKVGKQVWLQRHTGETLSTPLYSVHMISSTTDVQDLYPKEAIYLLGDGTKFSVDVRVSDFDVDHTGGRYGYAYYVVSLYWPLTENQVRLIAEADSGRLAMYDGASRRNEVQIPDYYFLNTRKFYHLFVLNRPEWTPEDEANAKADIIPTDHARTVQ